jgi:hypothetical protein
LCNVGGSFNVAIGESSMRVNVSGNNNTALGVQTLYCNTASNNTAVGFCALRANTTGTSNIALGANSGCAITTGACNVVIGSSTASSFATQNCNIIISDGAGNIRMFTTGSTGFTGFGTTAPGFQVDINGTMRAVCVIETSSKRYKSSITNLPSQLTVVGKLRPVSFYWINPEQGNDLQFGLIAEEVKEVLPEVVTMNTNDEPEGISYTKLVPILVKAIQEMWEEITILKSKVN